MEFSTLVIIMFFLQCAVLAFALYCATSLIFDIQLLTARQLHLWATTECDTGLYTSIKDERNKKVRYLATYLICCVFIAMTLLSSPGPRELVKRTASKAGAAEKSTQYKQITKQNVQQSL